MKKIKFGSFPVSSISKSNRQCIDTFCMKNFASLITMSTAMGNIENDINKYITPDIIMKYFKNPEEEYNSYNGEININNKTKTMRRAFKAIKGFYKTIGGVPFYRDHKIFPIYLEHTNKNNSNDYDFLLLSNDLINANHLDEINYSDQLSLIFMILKDQFYKKDSFNSFGQKSNQNEIRAQVASFIDYSKNNNTDPITAFLNIIKLAGDRKERFNNTYTGQSSRNIHRNEMNFSLKNVFGSSTLDKTLSSELKKLFKDGEIVDVNYLLKTIETKDIQEFLDEEDNKNTGIHIQDKTSKIERQFISKKVSEYNKILSLVDSLMAFNKETKVLTDMNEISADKIEITTPGERGDEVELIDIKKNEVVNSIRTTYYEPFVQNVVIKTNLIFTDIRNRFLDTSGDDGESEFDLKSRFKQATEHIQQAREEYSKAQESDDTNRIEIAFRALDSAERERRDLHNLLMIDPSIRKAETEEDKKAKIKRESSNLQYNLDVVQNDLTALLSSLETSITNIKNLEELFQLIGVKKRTFDLVDLQKTNVWKDIALSIESLDVSIQDSIKDSVHAEISQKEYLQDPSLNTEDKTKMLYDEDNEDHKKMVELLNKIKPIIEKQLYLLFIKLGRQFGTMQLNAVANYSESRIANHPTISNMLKDINNFKTYIFSEELLLNLYKILNYIDNQKYIAGLLRIPPSRISNELNQLEFIIKRFGLTDNPVFIIGKGNVILSSPDYMSMTGQPFIKKIPFIELENICRIDYSKDMWDDREIMQKVDNQNKYDKMVNLRNQAKLDGDLTDEYLEKFRKYEVAKKKNNNKRSDKEKALISDWEQNEKKEYRKIMQDKSKKSYAEYQKAEDDYENSINSSRHQPIGISTMDGLYDDRSDKPDGYNKQYDKHYRPKYMDKNNNNNKHNNNKHNNNNYNKKW